MDKRRAKAVDDEDEATLAAIGEGIADARDGRVISAKKRRAEIRKVCTAGDLAKALEKTRLTESEAKVWRRDIREARRRLLPVKDKLR